MKEVPISNSERAFIAEVIASKQRLDGRELDHHRPLKINFGADWGSVHVSLGETRVLAQVSCAIGQPKATRPTEGQLLLKLELGPMAAPHFEANRAPSDASVQCGRILERAFKDSGCLDLESLCVVADEKVWHVRVDLNVLNHEGNIVDCAAVAVLAALGHFKRPDVTIDGDEVIVHTLAQRDPIPMVLHHYPVCVSYGIFQNGAIAVADPTALEERCSEAQLVFGLNSYRELCGLHFGGITMAHSQLLLKCATRAANHARYVVDTVRSALKLDAEQRAAGQATSFTECVRLQRITALAQDRLAIRLKRFQLQDHGDDEAEAEEGREEAEEAETRADDSIVVALNAQSAALVPQTPKWVPESDCEHSSTDNEDDVEMQEELAAVAAAVAQTKATKNVAATAAQAAKSSSKKPKKPKAKGRKSAGRRSESEEEETVVMESVQ